MPMAPTKKKKKKILSKLVDWPLVKENCGSRFMTDGLLNNLAKYQYSTKKVIYECTEMYNSTSIKNHSLEWEIISICHFMTRKLFWDHFLSI